MFDNDSTGQGDSANFSPTPTDLQGAAQQELARRKQIGEAQTEQGKEKVGDIASKATGIVGAIIGGYFGGPAGALAGYKTGSGIGTTGADAITGAKRKDSGGGMPGMEQIQAMFGKKKPGDTATAAAGAAAGNTASDAAPAASTAPAMASDLFAQ
jgi:hypothetical protein